MIERPSFERATETWGSIKAPPRQTIRPPLDILDEAKKVAEPKMPSSAHGPHISRRFFIAGGLAAATVLAAPRPGEAQESHERTPSAIAERLRAQIPTELVSNITLHEGGRGPIIIGIPTRHFRDEGYKSSEDVQKIADIEIQVDRILEYITTGETIDAVTYEGFPNLGRAFSVEELERDYDAFVASYARSLERTTNIPAQTRFASLKMLLATAKHTPIFGMEDPENYLYRQAANSALDLIRSTITDASFRKTLQEYVATDPRTKIACAFFNPDASDDPILHSVWKDIFGETITVAPQSFTAYRDAALRILEQHNIAKRHAGILKSLNDIPSTHTQPIIVVPLGANHFKQGHSPAHHLPYNSIIDDALEKGFSVIEVRPRLVPLQSE